METQTLTRSKLAIAAVLATSALAFPVLAQTSPESATTTAKATAQDRDMMKMSQNGFQAIRAVRAARVAIFNANPQVARDLLSKAKSDLEAATKEAPIFIIDVKTGVNGKIVEDSKSVEKLNLIPIDGQVVLADSFVATPEKKSHIDKANEHFGKSRSKDGIEELRLAEVDASFTRVLMPLDITTKRVAEATKLLGQQKYYEANLALKAIEDGIRLDTVVLSENPTASKTPKSNK